MSADQYESEHRIVNTQICCIHQLRQEMHPWASWSTCLGPRQGL